jgi:hypothetical protein
MTMLYLRDKKDVSQVAGHDHVNALEISFETQLRDLEILQKSKIFSTSSGETDIRSSLQKQVTEEGNNSELMGQWLMVQICLRRF